MYFRTNPLPHQQQFNQEQLTMEQNIILSFLWRQFDVRSQMMKE